MFRIFRVILAAATMAACGGPSADRSYLDTVSAANLFVDVCGPARHSFAQADERLKHHGFVQYGTRGFRHGEWAVWGQKSRTAAGSFQRRDGYVHQWRAYGECEMQFDLLVPHACRKGDGRLLAEEALFTRIVTAKLGPERDLNNVNSRGLYITPSFGGKVCHPAVNAVLTFD